MTTSVYKPIDFTSLSRGGVDRRMFCRPGIQKVKRALFEVDHEATDKFIQEEFDKRRVIESERWNFDFKHERTLNPNGNFVWQVVAAAQVPQKPKKRPAEPSDLLQDLYAQPDDIIKPKALRPNAAGQEDCDRSKTVNNNNNNTSHQTTITDFLKQKKRPLPAEKKASDRPAKISKLADIVS